MAAKSHSDQRKESNTRKRKSKRRTQASLSPSVSGSNDDETSKRTQAAALSEERDGPEGATVDGSHGDAAAEVRMAETETTLKEIKKKKKKKRKQSTATDELLVGAEGENANDVDDAPSHSQGAAAKPETPTFGALYLQQLTTELAGDLDAIRRAPDFRDDSLPLLIHALRQGETIFSEEEKRRVVEAATAKATAPAFSNVE